jgi:hypothetical protein
MSSSKSYFIHNHLIPLTRPLSIVFVHGITGNRETTWTYKNKPPIFWPKDLLPADLPKARIITFGYDADVIGVLSTAGGNSIRDHGTSLAEDIAMRRIRTGTVSLQQ